MIDRSDKIRVENDDPEVTANRSHSSEQALVEKARQDPQAFGQLFDRYYPDILNYLIHRTANVALAQELCSNTFYTALRKLWQFKWRGLPFSAWLYRIASNEANAWFRKHRNYQTVPLEAIGDRLPDQFNDADRELLAAEEKLQSDIMYIELHRSIARLKPRYQEVIVLRFFEKKKIREIAEIRNTTNGTIKSRIHRAIKLLREELETAERQARS